MLCNDCFFSKSSTYRHYVRMHVHVCVYMNVLIDFVKIMTTTRHLGELKKNDLFGRPE